MSDPMRIRLQTQSGLTTVKVLMSHEMESGQRKTDDGRVVPIWNIQDVSASLNGKIVMSAEWGGGISKNPFLQFVIKGTKSGDKISITWRDNRGDSRTDEAVVV
jgi:sulfur-oxidizing protein SoxZ